MGSPVSFFIAGVSQGVCHSSRLICSLMTLSATSQLRLDFHHIKVDFKKSEVIQPLIHKYIYIYIYIYRERERERENSEYIFIRLNIYKWSKISAPLVNMFKSFKPPFASLTALNFKSSFFVSSDHRNQSHFKFQACGDVGAV